MSRSLGHRTNPSEEEEMQLQRRTAKIFHWDETRDFLHHESSTLSILRISSVAVGGQKGTVLHALLLNLHLESFLSTNSKPERDFGLPHEEDQRMPQLILDLAHPASCDLAPREPTPITIPSLVDVESLIEKILGEFEDRRSSEEINFRISITVGAR
jgi:hypothetical protein